MRDNPSMESTRVRAPAVAGLFYPGSAEELAAEVDAALEAAHAPEMRPGTRPKAVIAPHAGYRYSAPIAASAYRAFDALSQEIERVVILGPSHRYPIDAVSVSGADEFATPLGSVPVDTRARDVLAELDCVDVDDAAHVAEHSIEVHVPFVQRVFPAAAIVPLAVGRASPADVARVLDAVWDGDTTVVVVSSDLSHYHDHDTAARLDAETAAKIEAGLYDEIDTYDACGAAPVRGLLYKISGGSLHVDCVDLRNSGDTAGSPDRVVGYGAFVVA